MTEHPVKRPYIYYDPSKTTTEIFAYETIEDRNREAKRHVEHISSRVVLATVTNVAELVPTVTIK